MVQVLGCWLLIFRCWKRRVPSRDESRGGSKGCGNFWASGAPEVVKDRWCLGKGFCFVFFSLRIGLGPEPMEGFERTCMTQGCFDPQNDATFEGPMILRVVEKPRIRCRTSDLQRKASGSQSSEVGSAFHLWILDYKDIAFFGPVNFPRRLAMSWRWVVFGFLLLVVKRYEIVMLKNTQQEYG